MAKQWRCAVLGAGGGGEWDVRVITQLPKTTLGAVCDVSGDNAKKAFDKNNLSGIPVYKDLATMLKSEKLDVVHICTPSGFHLEPALAVLNAGVNVISEKPLEIALDRIDKMIETA